MAISAPIGGVPIPSGQDGGAVRAAAAGPPDMQPEVRVRAKDGPEDGALGHGQPRLAAPLGHSLRFPSSVRVEDTGALLLGWTGPVNALPDLLFGLRSHSSHPAG